MFSRVLRNIEDNTITDYYTNIGSLWFNRHSEVQEWLREQERVRLDPDNMERPDTKWVAVGFSGIDTKVVRDRQTLMGTGPLPEWLRNLAHGRAMMALDNYKDNLCLWRCIAVHRGFLPHRSTLAARELAKSFFELEAKPVDVEKTSLDELEKVEKHLNKNVPFSEWIGIMVYEPEQGVDGELTWFLRRSPPAKLENILTIGIHNGHAFVIKDIAKLAKTYACVNCQARFTKACNRMCKGVPKERRWSIVWGKESKPHREHTRRRSFPSIQHPQNRFGGWNEKQNGREFTFTMWPAVTAASGGLD